MASKDKRKPIRFSGGNPADPWNLVHAIEINERRQFDPFTRHFAILSDEAAERLLSFAKGGDSPTQAKKILIHELLFELDWRLDSHANGNSVEEMYLWDDIQAFIRRYGEQCDQTFAFALWTIFVGRKIAAAWRIRDDEFFARHADLWRVLCQTDPAERRRAPTHIAKICGTASALRQRLKRNPTKKELREAIAQDELRISEKDWPKYLKKCGLTFLPQAKAGRPKAKKSPDSSNPPSDRKTK